MYICDVQDGDMTVVERRVSLKDPVSPEADVDMICANSVPCVQTA